MGTLERTAFGILLPFIGTTLGAATVYFFHEEMSDRLQKILLGFASGVMIASSVWSLLIPSMAMTEASGGIGCIPAVIGFSIGIAFFLIVDAVIPGLNTANGNLCLGRSFMLVLAITLHNIPEGMAVGVVFAGMLQDSSVINIAAAMTLSIGIAIQNFPEGAVISTPLITDGFSKNKAFLYGAFSGVVEPIGAVLTILLTAIVTPILPYILSFAAGAMIYVVIEELIPELQAGKHNNDAIIGVTVGFSVMMTLDNVL